MSKKREKKRTKKRRMRPALMLDVNVDYWKPLDEAIAAQAGSIAIAAVSTDVINDRVYDALVNPLEQSLEAIRLGKATFNDFWRVTLLIYYTANLYHRVIHKEPMRFEDVEQQLLITLDLEARFHKVEDVFSDVIYSIGEREKRTKRYGFTGDEYKLLQECLGYLKDLLSWVSLRAVYHTSQHCFAVLSHIEHERIRTKANELSNTRF